MRHFLVAGAGLFALATGAHAVPVTIDSFDTGFQQVTAPDAGMNPVSSTVVTPDAIGGTRTITNTRTSPTGTGQGFFGVETVATSGFASVSLAAMTQGFSVMDWNAGGADLTSGGVNDAIQLDIMTTDLNVNFAFSIGGQTVSQSTSGSLTMLFDFADFAGVDFTSVDNISLMISGQESFDTLFDLISTVDTDGNVPAPIPLPAGLPLALAGIGALVGLRRMKKA